MSSLDDGRWRRKPPVLPAGIRAVARQASVGAYWRFEVRWQDPTSGRKLVELLDRPQDAIDFKAHLRLLKRRDALGDIDRGRESLNAFAREWFAKHAARALSERTLAAYAGIYDRHLAPRVGVLELRQLRPRVIDQLRTALLDGGVGEPTVRKALAVLSAILTQAVVWDRIDANPVRQVRNRRHAGARSSRRCRSSRSRGSCTRTA